MTSFDNPSSFIKIRAFNSLQMHNEALVLPEDICLAIANKLLVQLGMAVSNRSANDLFDGDLQPENHFSVYKLGSFVQTNLPKLVLNIA